MELQSIAVAFRDLSVFQVVCYGCISLCLAVAIKHRYFSSISSIPGPALGTVATLFQTWEIWKGTAPQTVHFLHRKWGPFVRISYKEVSVNHPEALPKLLALPVLKPAAYDLFAIPNINYQNLMSQRSISDHTGMLRNLASAYTMSSIIKSEGAIDEAIALLSDRLNAKISEHKPIELSQWLHFTTWDIMGIATYSRPFGFLEQGKDVGDSIKNSFGLAFYLTSMMNLHWLNNILLGNPILRWIDFQPADHAFDVAKKAVAARKADTEPRRDMMQHWLERKQKHPEIMTDHLILCAALQNLGAGGDTAGSVLQAFFYFLLKEDKRFREKLRAEIDAADARGELSKVISYAEAQRLPYLQAVLKETGRLYPGVQWNIPRIVPDEGLTLAGRRFVKGTILSVNPWVIHRNQECFGKDADEYNPERWLGDPDVVKHMEKNFILFGSGYNRCIGVNLATLEMNKIAATLIRDFDFHLVEPDKEWKHHFLVITVPWGWPVWMRPRQRAVKESLGRRVQDAQVDMK